MRLSEQGDRDSHRRIPFNASVIVSYRFGGFLTVTDA